MKGGGDGQILICVVLITAGLFLWPDPAMGGLFARLVLATMWFVVISTRAEFGEPGTRIVDRVCLIAGPLLFAVSFSMTRSKGPDWVSAATAFGGAACLMTSAGLYRRRTTRSPSSSAAVWTMIIGALAGIGADSIEGTSLVRDGLYAGAIAGGLFGALLTRQRPKIIH